MPNKLGQAVKLLREHCAELNQSDRIDGLGVLVDLRERVVVLEHRSSDNTARHKISDQEIALSWMGPGIVDCIERRFVAAIDLRREAERAQAASPSA